VDNLPDLTLFFGMAQSEEKLVTPVTLVVDFILVVGFFLYMFSVLRGHVPSSSTRMMNLWGAVGSSCITAVFWLALQMVRVVFRFQRATRK
jgi:RsiW-degrading membrane proteinase PrsW (M82 family)